MTSRDPGGILSDTELILGLSRHLGAYAMSPERAALDTIEFAGWVFDMAFRLRGSTTSSPQRVRAIALDVGLGPRDIRDVIATMQNLSWVAVDRDPATGQPRFVAESIPAPRDLIKAADHVMTICNAEASDWAVLALLRTTTLQPSLREDALSDAAAAHSAGDEAAQDALRYLLAVGLLKTVKSADGREVLYNPNIWTRGAGIAEAAIKIADARATNEVKALLEEVAANPGIPEVSVKSTEAKWVNFAVAQGLVQRSMIQTSEGVEQGFLFTPHLCRDTFGGTAGDASGQVRQLVGSMIYAATFAEYKLGSPAAFINALIRDGVAGNASPIGTDYPMLEKAGIVTVVQGSGKNRYRLELKRSDVAEEALVLLNDREAASVGSNDFAALRAQRTYVHTERERARLALSTEVDEVEQAKLLAALREVPTQRAFGGRP